MASANTKSRMINCRVPLELAEKIRQQPNMSQFMVDAMREKLEREAQAKAKAKAQ